MLCSDPTGGAEAVAAKLDVSAASSSCSASTSLVPSESNCSWGASPGVEQLYTPSGKSAPGPSAGQVAGGVLSGVDAASRTSPAGDTAAIIAVSVGSSSAGSTGA